MRMREETSCERRKCMWTTDSSLVVQKLAEINNFNHHHQSTWSLLVRVASHLSEGKGLGGRRPFLWVLVQHPVYQTSDLLGEQLRKRRKVSVVDALENVVEVLIGSLEGRGEGSELVEETSKAPDVRLEVVALAVKHLRRHVQGCTDLRESFHGLSRENSSKSEITKLQNVVCGDENIRWLNVSMHHSLLMHMSDRPSDL
mmetsp:Transcript_1391/g.3042  ORF Transcript_1391/g.3042 Transcript_1391/m.3042 type:complete len:200 (-) Transcript_1391:826-1425(-)